MNQISREQLHQIEARVQDIFENVSDEQNPALAQFAINMYKPLQNLKRDIILQEYPEEARAMFDDIKNRVFEDETINGNERQILMGQYIYALNSDSSKHSYDVFEKTPDYLYNNFYVIPTIERDYFNNEDIDKINDIQRKINEVMFTNYHNNFLKKAHQHNQEGNRDGFEEALQNNYLTSLKVLARYDSEKNDAFMAYLNKNLNEDRKRDFGDSLKFQDSGNEHIANHITYVSSYNQEVYVSDITEQIKESLSGNGRLDDYMKYIDDKIRENPNLTQKELMSGLKNDFEDAETKFLKTIVKSAKPDYTLRIHTHNMLAGQSRAQMNTLDDMLETLRDKLPNKMDNLIQRIEKYAKGEELVNEDGKRFNIIGIKNAIERQMKKDPQLKEHLESMEYCYQEEQAQNRGR